MHIEKGEDQRDNVDLEQGMLAGNSSLPSSEAKKWQQAFLEAKAQARPKRIQSLVQDEGLIEGHEQLKYYITIFYKGLFGLPEESSFSLDENQMDDIPQVFFGGKWLIDCPLFRRGG
jgi:hypothetical protein